MKNLLTLLIAVPMMEERPYGFTPAKDVESSYLTKEDAATQSPYSDKHVLLSLPSSEPMCTLGGCEHLKVGAFFEIDHSKLSPKSPEQLKFIRVVMVSEKTKLQVSLRYPSIHSLRRHFTEGNLEKPDGKKIPSLDEKYVMGSEFASEVLCRRVPMEEFSVERNSWRFWVTPSDENGRDKSPALTDESNILGCKKGSCWSQLNYTGMVQWGKRQKVRFLGRHEEQKFESLVGSLEREETGVDKKEQKGREGGSKKKRKNDEDTEDVQAVSLEVRRTRQSERNQNERTGIQKSKGSKTKKQSQVVIYGKKRKLSIDRWSAERYKLAEESMLKVMKAKGAVYGNPMLRPALRTEARKLIGDTGLLDHLLKHMAGKVAPGGAYRFRRRHNAEGSMEYWLESADLVNIRREAGVEDPYWTPPLGWKPGDNPSQDPICAKEIREMKDEIAKLKIDVQELLSKKQEEALAIVATPSCLSSLSLDNDGSLTLMQEMYVELVNKKAKIDEKLEEISKTLSGMEEQLGMLKSGVGEPIMSESVTPPALLSGTRSMEAGHGRETIEGEDRNKVRKSDEEQIDDDEDLQRPESRTAEDKATKIQRLRTGFQIFKSQGSFIWPNFFLSPDQTVVPTPPSASSSTTSATRLVPVLQSPNVPKPSSPVKALAEKRPVNSAILTHVTNPFTPAHLSAPRVTPKAEVTATQKAALINLNEAPPPPTQIYDTSFCGTPKLPRLILADEKDGLEICDLRREKENSSSSSARIPEKKGWWQQVLKGAD